MLSSSNPHYHPYSPQSPSGTIKQESKHSIEEKGWERGDSQSSLSSLSSSLPSISWMCSRENGLQMLSISFQNSEKSVDGFIEVTLVCDTVRVANRFCEGCMRERKLFSHGGGGLDRCDFSWMSLVIECASASASFWVLSTDFAVVSFWVFYSSCEFLSRALEHVKRINRLLSKGLKEREQMDICSSSKEQLLPFRSFSQDVRCLSFLVVCENSVGFQIARRRPGFSRSFAFASSAPSCTPTMNNRKQSNIKGENKLLYGTITHLLLLQSNVGK